ncbi:MAG: hypothetical protein ACI9CA_001263 [Natronomonas sp.]|jgi:hypothetical protein
MSRLVPDPSAERLNERQQPDHRGFRRDSQEWLHDQDYSNSVVRPALYRTDKWVRWVWDRHGYTADIGVKETDSYI